MNRYVYEKIDSLPFDGKCHIPDYHSVISIQLCELQNDGFFDLTRPDWDFGPKFSPEQHAQLCRKITEHYWYREIGIVPPGIWKHEFLRFMNEIMPKYMPWYKMVYERAGQLGHSYDYITGAGTRNATGNSTESTHGNSTENSNKTISENSHELETRDLKNDEYSKGRAIFSDFPQTALSGRNQDYASTGNDNEYEKINEDTGTRTIDGTRNVTEHGTKTGETSGTKNGTTNDNEMKDYRETREHVADPLSMLDNILLFDNIDASIIQEIEPLFSCLITANINAW